MIEFFNETGKDINISTENINNISDEIFGKYGYTVNYCNVILLSDNELLAINKSFLNHDYYTDIITFNYGEEKSIEAELYISIERVMDNSDSLKVAFENELYRVIIHGILHLCGFKDKTEKQKREIRLLEDKYLEIVSRETM